MKTKRFLSAFVAVSVGVTILSPLTAFATDNETAPTSTTGDIQVFSTATLEDDFTDDVVLIAFKHENSIINKVWTPEDFPECDNIASVVDITYTENSQEWIDEYLQKVEFRQLIALHLEETGKDKVLEAIEQLETRTDVKTVDVNSILEECATVPNDVTYQEEYDPFDLVDLYEAWDIETGSSSVQVGVIDSGMYSHEDLIDNATAGWDGYHHSEVTSDDFSGHGTAVASVIGAVGNNDLGICGVAWDVTLVPLQDISTYGSHNIYATAEVLQTAAERNIPIVNISLACTTSLPYFDNIARNYPGLIVAAAGNEGVDIDETPCYPAALEYENIITVGATNTYGNRWYMSNYGDESVDLFAPGEQIKVAKDSTKYTTKAGTSFAAPFVAGAAALLLSYNPNLTTAQLREAILSTVQPIESLEGKCVTGGLLNVNNALNYVTEGNKKNSYVINIYVEESSCISTAAITTTYDATLLDFNSINQGSAIPNSEYWSGSKVYDGLVICQYQNPTGGNDLIRAAGTIAKISFTTVFNIDNLEDFYTVTFSQLKLSNGNNVSLTYVSEEPFLLGDVNLDGTVNALDATMAARYANGTLTLTEPSCSACDVDLSGTVDSVDAELIAQYSVEGIDSFL